MTAFRTGACVLGRIRAFVAGGQADRAGVVLSHNQEHSKNLPRDTRENKDNNKRNYTITASKSIRPDQAAAVRDKGLKGTPGHKEKCPIGADSCRGSHGGEGRSLGVD